MTIAQQLIAVVMTCLSFISLAAPVSPSSKITKTHALSLLDEPKYPQDFKHLDYVNPAAPKGGTLSMNVTGQFDSFNPYIVQGNASWSIEIIYDTLLGYSADEPYTAYGLVAESIEIPEDRSWVAFNIHPKARFHDGTPITAEDLVFTLQILRKHGLPHYQLIYEQVASVTASSEKRVVYTFRTPNQRKLPFLIGQLPVLPKYFWENPAHDFTRPGLDIPLGSSAFRVGTYKAGHRVVYERVKDYWAKDLPLKVGRHNFDKVVYDYYRDGRVALEAFKSGAYNIRFEPIARDWYSNYKFSAVERGDIIKERIKISDTWGMNSFAFNIRRPWLSDSRVRQALILAFDFEATNKNQMQNEYSRITSYFINTDLASSGVPDAKELQLLTPFRDQLPEGLFTSPYPIPVNDGSGNIRNNLNKAMTLLNEAGYVRKNNKLVNEKTGKIMVLEMINSIPHMETVMVPYKKNLAKLGIDLKIKTIDSSQYIRRVKNFDFDLVNWAFGHERSPGLELLSQFGSEGANDIGSLNLMGISSPVVDELIRQTEQASSREELQTIIRALDRVLLWGHYAVPKWFLEKGQRVAYRKELKHPNIEGLNWFELSTWWYEPDAGNKPVKQR